MRLLDNLSHAAHNKETLSIGGGEFDAVEVYKELQAMRNALASARRLCNYIKNGGKGYMFLVDNFRLLDDMLDN